MEKKDLKFFGRLFFFIIFVCHNIIWFYLDKIFFQTFLLPQKSVIYIIQKKLMK